jgi:hypothetical protein
VIYYLFLNWDLRNHSPIFLKMVISIYLILDFELNLKKNISLLKNIYKIKTEIGSPFQFFSKESRKRSFSDLNESKLKFTILKVKKNLKSASNLINKSTESSRSNDSSRDSLSSNRSNRKTDRNVPTLNLDLKLNNEDENKKDKKSKNSSTRELGKKNTEIYNGDKKKSAQELVHLYRKGI